MTNRGEGMNRAEIESELAGYTKPEQQFRRAYQETGEPITEARLIKMLQEDGKKLQKSQVYSEEEWFQKGENILVCKHARYSPVSIHTHSFIEISYLLTGSCEETVYYPSGETEHLTLRQGDLFIIPPKLRHSVAVFDDSILINILIRTSIMKDTLTGLIAGNQSLFRFFLYTLYENENPNYLLFQTDQDEDIIDAVLRMAAEFLHPDSYSQQSLLFLTGTLFTNLQRTYSDRIQFSQMTSAGITYVPQILNYIQQHYQTVTVEELSRHFAVSTSWISRVFHKNAKMTIADAIQQIRVQKACELLRSTSLSVQAIAEQVGYQDVTYFIRMFKKHQQITPLRYRKSYSVVITSV